MIAKQYFRHSWKNEVFILIKQFTSKEDQRLIGLVTQLGDKKWQPIADILQKEFKARHINGKACRERYKNHLAPTVNKTQWTPEEAKILFDHYKQYGAKWSEISQHLQGRTDNSIKNYFYATLRRSLRRMLKAIGRNKSSNELGKVKPHVLTQLFDLMNDDMPTKDVKELSLIVHEVVSTFSDEKHNNLDQKQLKDYNKVLINLQNLNLNYIVEKQVTKAAQLINEKALKISRKSKVIYKIKRYIKETRENKVLPWNIKQNILQRLKNKQNIFILEDFTQKKQDSTQFKSQTLSRAQLPQNINKVKLTSEQNVNDPGSLHFIQPSQIHQYSLLQKIKSEELARQKSEDFFQIQPQPNSLLFYQQMQAEICELQQNFYQQNIPQLNYPNYSGLAQYQNSDGSKVFALQTLKQYQTYLQDQIKIEHQSDEKMSRNDRIEMQIMQPLSQITSLNKNMFGCLYDPALSLGMKTDCMINSFFTHPIEQFQRIQSEMLEQINSTKYFQNYQNTLMMIPSTESNLGYGIDSVKGDSQQFTDYYSISNNKPNPLKGLQKMNSDRQEKQSQ